MDWTSEHGAKDYPMDMFNEIKDIQENKKEFYKNPQPLEPICKKLSTFIETCN